MPNDQYHDHDHDRQVEAAEAIEAAEDRAVALVRAQHQKNVRRFGNPTYNSFHEAKAVCEEELDEMWDEIKMRNPDHEHIRKEAVDLAAAALAVIIEADVLA